MIVQKISQTQFVVTAALSSGRAVDAVVQIQYDRFLARHWYSRHLFRPGSAEKVRLSSLSANEQVELGQTLQEFFEAQIYNGVA